MNGDCREDVVKWFSTEFEAVSNRCVILLMDTPLRDLYTNKQLDQLRAGAQVLLHLLFTSYLPVCEGYYKTTWFITIRSYQNSKKYKSRTTLEENTSAETSL